MDDNDETIVPKEDENPAPEHVPDPVPAKPAHDDTREIVERLVSEVSDLRETVTALIPQEQDSSPVKQPWTHKRLF